MFGLRLFLSDISEQLPLIKLEPDFTIHVGQGYIVIGSRHELQTKEELNQFFVKLSNTYGHLFHLGSYNDHILSVGSLAIAADSKSCDCAQSLTMWSQLIQETITNVQQALEADDALSGDDADTGSVIEHDTDTYSMESSDTGDSDDDTSSTSFSDTSSTDSSDSDTDDSDSDFDDDEDMCDDDGCDACDLDQFVHEIEQYRQLHNKTPTPPTPPPSPPKDIRNDGDSLRRIFAMSRRFGAF